MPCYDPRNDVRVEYQNGVDPHYKKEAERLSARCKELTQLLCAVGRARYKKKSISPEVLNWWKDHCKLDHEHGEPG